MRNSIIYSLFVALLFFSCRKEDNPKIPDLTRVPTPLITKDPSAPAVIVASDAANFTGKVVVDLFFKTDEPPQKFDLVIIKNGNKQNVKVIQENITSFPTTVSFTGSQLATLFGEPTLNCEFYDLGIDVTTKDGQKFQAFPAVGVGYGGGVANQPGASTTVRYATKVEFVAADYAGDFEVVTDEWEDYHAGDIVPITVINDHQISFKYKAISAQPIIVNVDPETLKTSVTKQVYGTYAWPYGNASVESTSSADNVVAPCEGLLTVVLEHTVAAGSFGEYKIVLRKKS
jgi:hypothetical protein